MNYHLIFNYSHFLSIIINIKYILINLSFIILMFLMFPIVQISKYYYFQYFNNFLIFIININLIIKLMSIN